MFHKLSHNATLEFEKDKIVFTEGLPALYYAGLMMLGIPVLIYFIYSVATQQLNHIVASLGIISIASTIGGIYKQVNINRVSGRITIKWLLYKRYTLISYSMRTPLGVLSLEIRRSQEFNASWLAEEQIQADFYLMNNNEVITRLNSIDTFYDLKKHIVIDGEFLEVRKKFDKAYSRRL